MRTTELDSLADELELGAMVPGVPARTVIPPPPRLCEAGPCVNYHRFEIQLDAEGPKADSIEPGGQMSGTAPRQPFYVRVHHYCYPTVGVETDLGGLPVLRCNRWEPVTDRGQTELENKRAAFRASEAGKAFAADLAAWTAARALEQAESELEDDLATWVTMNLRDGDEVDFYGNGWTGSETMPSDFARAFLTTAWLKENFGANEYQLWIMRGTETDSQRNIVTTRKLEVS